MFKLRFVTSMLPLAAIFTAMMFDVTRAATKSPATSRRRGLIALAGRGGWLMVGSTL